jgi:hypothetical protein
VGERFDVLGWCFDAELKPAHLSYLFCWLILLNIGRATGQLLGVASFAAESVFETIKDTLIRTRVFFDPF